MSGEGEALTILPMRLQVGDRFTDEEVEWGATNPR